MAYLRIERHRSVRLRALALACALAMPGAASGSDAAEAEPTSREYTYGAPHNEWLMFFAEVGGQSGQYEYRIFGDGRLKWEHVHAQTRTIYSEGEVQLSPTQVADLFEFVVSNGLVDVVRETWAEMIGSRAAVTDSTTVVFQVKFASYESTVRSESEPFTQTISVYAVPSKLAENPDSAAVRALADLAKIFPSIARVGESNGNEAGAK